MKFSAKRLAIVATFGAAAAVFYAAQDDSSPADDVTQLQTLTNDSTAAPGVPVKKKVLEDVGREMFGLMNFIRQNHVDVANANDGEKTMADAINGVLAGLDPHSHYFTAEEFKQLNEQASGEFAGVGIEIAPEGRYIKVVTPMEDGPAYKAGILSGDIIIRVNDQPVTNMGVDQFVKTVRGPKGTSVNFKIMRPGSENPIDVTLVRDVIKTPVVKSAVLGNDIGYLRLSHFSYAKKDENGRIKTTILGKVEEDGATMLRDAILKLKSEMGPNAKGYILDLRSNPGGYQYQSVDVADHFLDSGKVVYKNKGPNPRSNDTGATKISGDLTDGKPLFVLVDEGSASASELVAGALQDHERATVMGPPKGTFGKGSVQTIMPLEGGRALKLTISQYYTPNDRSIQGKGIKPDIAFVPLKKDEREALRIREADLSHTLGNTKGTAEEQRTKATCSPAAIDTPISGLQAEFINKRTNNADDMLICAVENMRGTPRLTVTTPTPK